MPRAPGPFPRRRVVYSIHTMFSITDHTVEQLLLGSRFLATGGGLPPKAHRAVFKHAFAMKKTLQVRGIREFRADDQLGTVYGVGDPSRGASRVARLVPKAVAAFEKLTGRKLAGVIPGEIGAEGLAFRAAAVLHLPVVDSDLVGGRAAPEVQLDCFTVSGTPITPLIGEGVGIGRMIVTGNVPAVEVEKRLRRFFGRGSGVVVGYLVRAAQYRHIGMAGTISHAVRIGKRLAVGDLKGVLRMTDGTVVGIRCVEAVNLASRGGFLKGWVTLGDLKLWIKNENLLLVRGGVAVATAPDLIVLMDERLRPIHASELVRYLKKSVTIVRLPATGYWKQQRARRLWAPVIAEAARS
jgi:DUF917 family protein